MGEKLEDSNLLVPVVKDMAVEEVPEKKPTLMIPRYVSKENGGISYKHAIPATGAKDASAALTMMMQVAAGSAILDETHLHVLNGAMALMAELKPHDAFEGMLIAQMITVHHQAMSFMGRALRVSTPELTEKYNNMASKLHRTYAAQLEALNRYRRKGNQTVVVQHVNVNDGGQAIVGNVDRGGREGE